MSNRRILRRPDVRAKTGLSDSTIYLRMSQGRFPLPIALGARAVGWLEHEVDEWIEERINETRSHGTTEDGE